MLLLVLAELADGCTPFKPSLTASGMQRTEQKRALVREIWQAYCRLVTKKIKRNNREKLERVTLFKKILSLSSSLESKRAGAVCISEYLPANNNYMWK